MRNTAKDTGNIIGSNFEFLILAGILAVINIPYMRKSFVPIHDTHHILQMFHYIYNAFALHGEFPAWIPYGVCGSPINLFQMAMTPASYLVGLLGFCSGVQNTLLLFKLSVVIEQLIFLFGLYRLCRAIFRSRSAVFLVCLAGVCSIAWYWSLGWNLRLCYLLPFATHSLLAFFWKEEPSYFWIAGIFLILPLASGATYCFAIYLLIATVFSLPLYFNHKKAVRSLFSPTKRNIIFFSFFLLIAGYICIMSIDFLTSSVVFSPGRNSSFGTVSPRVFITYGNERVPPWYGFLVGWPPRYGGCTHYVGLLTIVSAIWAFLKVRTSTSTPFLAVIFILFWFSLGGFFSMGAYFFPGMFYFRHIYQIYPVYKFFLLIAAGFGFEDLWERLLSYCKKNKAFSWRVLCVIFLSSVFLVDLSLYSYVFNGPFTDFSEETCYLMAGVTLLRVIVYIIGFVFIKRYVTNNANTELVGSFRLLKPITILMACVFFDIFSFQATVHYYAYKHSSIDPLWAQCFDIREMPYRGQKSNDLLEDRQKYALKIAKRQHQNGLYPTQNLPFMMMEPPWYEQDERIETLSPGMHQLIKSRCGIDKNGRPSLPLQDPWLHARMGISQPKIRVVSNVVIAKTLDEALAYVRECKNESDPDVLLLEKSLGLENNHPAKEVKPTFPIVKHFSANEIIVEAEVEDKSAWLVYADAHHSGWKAWVNGQKVPVVKANLAFKAVPLSQGRNTVKFKFNNGFYTLYGILLLISNVLFLMPLPVVSSPKDNTKPVSS